MHTLTGRPLHICDGAVVDLIVQICSLERAKRQQSSNPFKKTVSAQIDTGASRSCVHFEILKTDFGLTKIDTENILDVSTGQIVEKEIFMVDLSLVINGWNGSWGDRRVAAANLTHHGCKALIGYDLLSDCVFTYDGPKKSFSLSLP